MERETPDAYESAVHCFEEALDVDGDSARAWAGLSLAHDQLALLKVSTLEPAPALQEALHLSLDLAGARGCQNLAIFARRSELPSVAPRW